MDIPSASSPPISPTATSKMPTSPLDTTGAREYSLRHRRTSSLSSNHDRSPVSVRSRRHRFSGASFESFSRRESMGGGDGFGASAQAEGGMGNLADELDQVSDEGEGFDEGDGLGDEIGLIGRDTEDVEGDGAGNKSPSTVIDSARDSGIDVSYKDARQRFVGDEMRPPDEEDELDDRLTPELEELINTVMRMAAAIPTSSEESIVARTINLLQDLGNMSSLESSAARLTTSTNSMTSHLTSQSRAMQSLAASLYTPFGPTFLDYEALAETIPLIDTLVQQLPRPDTAPLHGLQRLDRESAATIAALATLTDTLQIGKQHTNAASRHLRNTETVVVELRRERERADAARRDLAASGIQDRFRDRWCRSECRDILDGFAQKCDALREVLAQPATASA